MTGRQGELQTAIAAGICSGLSERRAGAGDNQGGRVKGVGDQLAAAAMKWRARCGGILTAAHAQSDALRGDGEGASSRRARLCDALRNS
ncbi:hypothetical protein FGB62_9g321 [Gracilaria domingensis]|nr:hypothetical protein FGB62_9g321 [Gracilaria domingensis]